MASIIKQLQDVVNKLPWVRTKNTLANKYITLYNSSGLPVGRVSARAFKFEDKYTLFPIPTPIGSTNSDEPCVSSSSPDSCSFDSASCSESSS